MSMLEAQWSNELIEFLNAIEPARVEINRIAGVEMVSQQDVITANLRKRIDAQKADHIRDEKVNPKALNKTNPLLKGDPGKFKMPWNVEKIPASVKPHIILTNIILTPEGEHDLMIDTPVNVWHLWMKNLKAAQETDSCFGSEVRKLTGCIALTDEGIVYSVAEPSCSA